MPPVSIWWKRCSWTLFICLNLVLLARLWGGFYCAIKLNCELVILSRHIKGPPEPVLDFSYWTVYNFRSTYLHNPKGKLKCVCWQTKDQNPEVITAKNSNTLKLNKSRPPPSLTTHLPPLFAPSLLFHKSSIKCVMGLWGRFVSVFVQPRGFGPH